VRLTLVEVCVGSVADIHAAVRGGAGRVELCGALELGGLTPSIGLVEKAREATSLPIVAMLRPRAGGFCYDSHEFAAMLSDAERFLESGVDGLVFGVLDREGRIDAARCRAIVEVAGTRECVFHRAFDFVLDQPAALDGLINLGVVRVLTSGGAATAVAGATALRDLVEHARDRIEILAGGGIRADQVAALVRQTGCSQIHIGAATGSDDGSLQAHRMPSLADTRFLEGPTYRIVDSRQVSEVVAALKDPNVGRPRDEHTDANE
jgi:copper homeostasis protein